MSGFITGGITSIRSVASYFRKMAGIDSAKIFILPTWFSIIFNLALLFMLVASFPLRSIPLLALSIFIIFIELLAMVESHVNLREVIVSPGRDILLEASSLSVLTLQVSSREQSLGLNVRLINDREVLRDQDGRISARHLRKLIFEEIKAAVWHSFRGRGSEALSTIKAEREPQTLQLAFEVGRRGAHRLPPLLVYSYFPFGLFRAVKIIELSDLYLAYPTPMNDAAAKRYAAKEIASEARAARNTSSAAGAEDYAHHRPFEFGDALRRVDWRASSRRGATVVRVFDTTRSDQSRVLRWQDTVSRDVEGKLSELSSGVIESAKAGDLYALEMPHMKTKVGHGERHKVDCLRVLAAFSNADGKGGSQLS